MVDPRLSIKGLNRIHDRTKFVLLNSVPSRFMRKTEIPPFDSFCAQQLCITLAIEPEILQNRLQIDNAL